DTFVEQIEVAAARWSFRGGWAVARFGMFALRIGLSFGKGAIGHEVEVRPFLSLLVRTYHSLDFRRIFDDLFTGVRLAVETPEPPRFGIEGVAAVGAGCPVLGWSGARHLHGARPILADIHVLEVWPGLGVSPEDPRSVGRDGVAQVRELAFVGVVSAERGARNRMAFEHVHKLQAAGGRLVEVATKLASLADVRVGTVFSPPRGQFCFARFCREGCFALEVDLRFVCRCSGEERMSTVFRGLTVREQRTEGTSVAGARVESCAAGFDLCGQRCGVALIE